MNSKILTLVALIVATASGPAGATTIFSDDFSTFTPGNLAGQHGWAATVGANLASPASFGRKRFDSRQSERR